MTTEDKGMELKAEFVTPGPYAYRLYDEEDGTWIVFSTDPKILIREHGEMLGPMDKETARYMALHMNIAHVEAWNRRHSDANKVLDELENKVKLKFMVDPDYLKCNTFIDDPVRCVVTDPEAVFLMGILGDSGREMVKAGFPFYFERPLAEKLIKAGFAEAKLSALRAEGEKL